MIVIDIIEPFQALTLMAMHFSVANFEIILEIGLVEDLTADLPPAT